MKIKRLAAFLAALALLCAQTAFAGQLRYAEAYSYLGAEGWDVARQMQTSSPSIQFGITDACRVSGTRSRVLNTADMAAGDFARLMANAPPPRYSCYVEAWVSGAAERPQGLNLCAVDRRGKLVMIPNPDVTREGVWLRLRGLVPPEVDAVYAGVEYVRSASDAFATLYFDDITLRIVPQKLQAADLAIGQGEEIDLNTIRLYAIDKEGTASLLGDAGAVWWSADSGRITQQKLFIPGDTDIAVLTARYYGLEARVTIRIRRVTLTPWEGAWGADIRGNTPGGAAAVTAVVYDGGRYVLFQTKRLTLSESGEASADFSDLSLPPWLKAPEIRFYATIQ